MSNDLYHEEDGPSLQRIWKWRAQILNKICVGVEHVGGDMFLSVPKGDAIFLKVRAFLGLQFAGNLRAVNNLWFIGQKWNLEGLE